MNSNQIKEVRAFFVGLTSYPFLLKKYGIHTQEEAQEFLNLYQEEEQIFEHFLQGLISQNVFYPINANKWIFCAKLCKYNQDAILNNSLKPVDGGPVSDWYIYPKFLQWLYRNALDHNSLALSGHDYKFLYHPVPLNEILGRLGRAWKCNSQFFIQFDSDLPLAPDMTIEISEREYLDLRDFKVSFQELIKKYSAN